MQRKKESLRPLAPLDEKPGKMVSQSGNDYGFKHDISNVHLYGVNRSIEQSFQQLEVVGLECCHLAFNELGSVSACAARNLKCCRRRYHIHFFLTFVIYVRLDE
jgi:hypothetical protein